MLRRAFGPGRHLLVLDAHDEGLAAAGLFANHEGRGELLMLVVSPDAEDAHAIEERMFGVIEAMCDALGSPTVDVPWNVIKEPAA